MIVLNKNLQVLTANRAFYDIFKLTPQQTENKLIYKLHKNAWDIPKLKVLLETILPANTHFDDYEVEVNLPHIGCRTILLNARKTYRQVNSTEAILLAFEDITDRKQMENQKDDFIGIVSHELKTPLTSIKAFSQLLERHLEMENDAKGSLFLSKMTQQMERLTQLMASFVNVYQIQNGKLSLHKQHFNINDLINSLVTDFQFTSKTHSIEYAPERSESIVYADRERIAQVIINLISNAIKYSTDENNIRITSTIESSTMKISVIDHGMGIPKDDIEKIFDRSFRVKGKKEKNISGLGLGLYISKEIMKQHKGNIWVEQNHKKGSTFHISLPLHQK